MKSFDIPVVLFSFVREDKILQIIDRLRAIKPSKVYLLSDGGRSPEEHAKVLQCRKSIEKSIDWDCNIVKRYSTSNIGVYENIGQGAKWVFEQEKYAIFLEDDNLPDITFFEFCKELLFKYQEEQQVLWICGTNYLKEYTPSEGSSYVFTRNMLPCGWASWSDKFIKYYDGDFSLWNDYKVKKDILKSYNYKQLYKQDYSNWIAEQKHKSRFGRYMSWDYQMSWSIRIHNLYGIVPKNNLIKNIGVDSFSIHGGTSMDNVMTSRFCNIDTISLDFPLKHPKTIEIDDCFEVKTAKIITYPFKLRVKSKMIKLLKKICGIDEYLSLTQELKNRFLRKIWK